MKTLVLLLAAVASAQQKDPGVPNAAVSGVVKDRGTGKPLANYNVSTYVSAIWLNDTILQNSATKQVKSVTDDHGRYKISDLPAGNYRIEARSAEGFGSNLTKRVTISGQDLEGIDFNVVVQGSITGQVIDENKEPVPGMSVYLVSREYYGGVLGYFLKAAARTDDRGEYVLTHVEAGRPYLVMAEKRNNQPPAHSDAPLDPRLRRRVPMRSFYPNSPSKEGAAAVTVRPGERREAVDIEIKKSPNYCVEATLMGAMGPAAMAFSMEGAQPSTGVSSGMSLAGGFLAGMTGADGKLRVCDLSPGTYRLAAMERSISPPGSQQPFPNHALAFLTIVDRDLQGLKIPLSPGPVLQGEVVWDGAAPLDPVNTKVTVSFTPLLRSGMQGENVRARADIPGTFSLNGLVTSDYALRTLLNAPGMYVKDVAFAGTGILYQPIHVTEAMQGSLRVVVARDGATISARITNKDGAAVPDIQVVVIPAEAASPAILQASMVVGAADQQGHYTTHTLAPGKYYVAAASDWLDATPESIDRLWRSRSRFHEVDVAPSGAAQVNLEPVKID